MHLLGIAAAALALVPAPKEQVWRDGTCAYVEADVRYVRDAALPPEGYRLEITTGGVTVASADDAGAFYARKTLKQLTNDNWSRGTRDPTERRSRGDRPTIPCCVINDAPAFRWRGFMLDEGRHFMGKETVKALLDQMADHKLNVFHWHLTEDQGWRLDIPRFPELVKYGSVRPESPVHGCRGTKGDFRGNGQQYGPYFYTAADIREILAYAKERFIMVVPEIEVPGHVRALLAAHPEFACKEGLPRVPCMFNGVQDEVLCAGNDDAIRFMEQVYDEVCALPRRVHPHRRRRVSEEAVEGVPEVPGPHQGARPQGRGRAAGVGNAAFHGLPCEEGAADDRLGRNPRRQSRHGDDRA